MVESGQKNHYTHSEIAILSKVTAEAGEVELLVRQKYQGFAD